MIRKCFLLLVFIAVAAFAYPPNIEPVAVYGASDWNPNRIAVSNNGTIYLSDTEHNCVRVLSVDGTELSTIAISKPLAIGVASNGDLLVSHGTTVSRYSATGTFVGNLGAEFVRPSDMVTASNGSIYITDSKAHQVKVFNANGTLNFSFGTPGNGTGQFMFPAGITMNANETELYVVDQGNARVQVFTTTGAFVRSIGQFTYQQGGQWIYNGTFTRPQSIAVDAFGRIYVSDLYQGDLQILDAQGGFSGRILTDPQGAHLFMHLMDVAIVGNRLYTVSTLTNNVRAFEVTDIVLHSNDPAGMTHSFALENNYPNPFNATTRIRFSLNDEKNVTLSIWNSIGQQVAILENSRLAAGRYEYTWNTERSLGITSGVYFYKLTAKGNNGTEVDLVKKMLLVK